VIRKLYCVLFLLLFTCYTSNDESITAALLVALEKYSESAESLDLSALTTYIAFDCVCEAAFGYQLGAVAGSEEGKRLHSSLCALVDAQAGKGMYANTQARKVSDEEMKEAQATWRNFLNKLLGVIKSESEQYKAKNGSLNVEKNFGHALIQLSESSEEYGDAQLVSEIHQVCGVLCTCMRDIHSYAPRLITPCHRIGLISLYYISVGLNVIVVTAVTCKT
jgi:hypothetical protein